MKRRVNDERLREMVRARATKGAAFMKCDYTALQQEWKDRLAKMTREEILMKYPEYTYDITKE